MTHQSSADPIYDYGLSLLRTAAPAAWGLIADTGIGHALGWSDTTGNAAAAVLFAVLWYAVWHAVEAHLPAWLTRAALGANTAPRYSTPVAPPNAPTINQRPVERDG